MNHAVFAEKTAPLGVVTLEVLDEGLVRERPSLKVYHVHLFLLNQFLELWWFIYNLCRSSSLHSEMKMEK